MKELFIELLKQTPQQEIDVEVNKEHDYLLIIIHTFNVGSYLTFESMHYDMDVERESIDNDNVFTDKFNFSELMEEIKTM